MTSWNGWAIMLDRLRIKAVTLHRLGQTDEALAVLDGVCYRQMRVVTQPWAWKPASHYKYLKIFA